MNSFDELFKQATGNAEPYPYQRRFATVGTLPQLLSVPTGVGKTATAVLGWLWRRRFAEKAVKAATPRRLVYCLPMRTLVEQTRDECRKWLKNLKLDDDVGLHLLMGGEDASDWDEHPERDAIIIGTQDMLLSRALNRGYGMSRYRWPMHFGLLNNDCLWVLDETQLMGVGVTTSSQLAGLRRKLQTFGSCQTCWMSATLDNDALETVDHPKPNPVTDGLTLSVEDRNHDRVKRLLNASKPASFAATRLDSATKGYEKSLSDEVAAAHRPGTLTLVVLNSVARSQDLKSAMQKNFAKSDAAPELYLIHSRFRPVDRQATQSQALDESSIDACGPGRIVIATQAIEAGVDISATTLFTELAPWSSLVQRFGRCNRRGVCGVKDDAPAAVYCIDIDTSDGKKSKYTLPYEAEQLNLAREALAALQDVGPQSLSGVSVTTPQPIVHVLRRKDLLDLFDTTPDLSGNDLDVSRYIRDSDDTDLQVYWRDWDRKEFPQQPPRPGKDRDADTNAFPAPHRNELCSVSIVRMRDFVNKLKDKVAWCWDPLDATWATVGKSNVRPGMTVLLHVAAGGYSADLGWTADPKQKPTSVAPAIENALDAMGDDDTKGAGQPVTLTQHLIDVATAAEDLKLSLGSVNAELPWAEILTAARWHDVGKAHEAFQQAMISLSPELDGAEFWAKAGRSGMPKYQVAKQLRVAVAVQEKCAEQAIPRGVSASVGVGDTLPDEQQFVSRRGFRHELASALAWLYHNRHAEQSSTSDLIAYLIAAHHGKVRLSIRSMPNERQPTQSDLKFARGIWEGDELPAIELGDGNSSTPFHVSLDLMNLGESKQGPSWLARTLALRDEYGPFRLAYLETLLRIADWRGSTPAEQSQ